MTIEEVRAVIRTAKQFDRAAGVALRLAAVAGLRRSGQRSKPDVRVALTKTPNRRHVRLDAETLAEIDALRQVREAVSPYLFSLHDGPPNPDRIGWWWTRIRKAAGIDLKWRLHDLRQWTATAASFSNGHDIRTVVGRLGHANPAMPMRVYAHVVEGTDQAVADSLGRALDASSV